jgi:PQQ-dependent catabolism-associated CXXCW motif protein
MEFGVKPSTCPQQWIDAVTLAAWAGPSLLLAISLAAPVMAQAPEPQDLWSGPMQGPTPSTLAGAAVLDAEELAELIAREKPLLIDVSKADVQPPTPVRKDIPWMPAHKSIPGAVWMPGAGSGDASPAFSKAFQTRIAALTAGDLGKPIVLFCHPNCWASWNAAKRLVALGYRRIHWYPDGIEGWQSAHPTREVSEDTLWSQSLK